MPHSILPHRPMKGLCGENGTLFLNEPQVGGTLDGEDVLPGFAYPVASIFADPLA